MRGCDVIVQRRRTTVFFATATLEQINFPMRQNDWLIYCNMEKLEQCLLFQPKYGAIWYLSFMFLANMERKFLNKTENSETASTEIDTLAYVLSIASVNASLPSLAKHAFMDHLRTLLSLRVKRIFFFPLHIAKKISEFTALLLLTVAALFWPFEFFDVAYQFRNIFLLP